MATTFRGANGGDGAVIANSREHADSCAFSEVGELPDSMEMDKPREELLEDQVSVRELCDLEVNEGKIKWYER